MSGKTFVPCLTDGSQRRCDRPGRGRRPRGLACQIRLVMALVEICCVTEIP